MTAYSKDHCLVQINQCSANSYMIDVWVKKEGALIPFEKFCWFQLNAPVVIRSKVTMGVFSFPFSSIRESSSFMQEQNEKPLRGWQRLIDAYSFFNSVHVFSKDKSN